MAETEDNIVASDIVRTDIEHSEEVDRIHEIGTSDHSFTYDTILAINGAESMAVLPLLALEDYQVPFPSIVPALSQVNLGGHPNSIFPFEKDLNTSQSEPSRIHEVFDRLPSATVHFGEMCMADVPPPPFTELGGMILSKKLLKLRLYHDKMKSNLDHEMAVYESLVAEENIMRNKITHRSEIVRSLADNAEKIVQECKEADSVYKAQRENLRVLKGYVVDTSEALAVESARFNECSTKLMRLRGQYPRIEEECEELTQRCLFLNGEISQARAERDRLEQALASMIRSNTQAAESVHVVSTESQTICDFTVLDEIECMRKELKMQLANMKKVQGTINLVRRCT